MSEGGRTVATGRRTGTTRQRQWLVGILPRGVVPGLEDQGSKLKLEHRQWGWSLGFTTGLVN